MARALGALYVLDMLDDYAKLAKPHGTRMAELALASRKAPGPRMILLR